jgi:hypothetical protein
LESSLDMVNLLSWNLHSIYNLFFD